jgi:hypothetical protein
MSLITEDGSGNNNSESYASVAEADGYHTKFGNTVWLALEQERKEILLRRATDYISDTFRFVFMGRKAFSTQALEWPRYSSEPGQFGLQAMGVPRGVKEATIELALLADAGPLIPTNSIRGTKRVKVGPIEVEYDSNSPSQNKFVTANLKLSPWLKAGSMNGHNVRLIRV